MGSAIKGWDELAKKLGEHVEPVIEFFEEFHFRRMRAVAWIRNPNKILAASRCEFLQS